MKKQAIVLITIDTDAEAGSSSTHHDEGEMMDSRTHKFVPTSKFEINVVPSDRSRKDDGGMDIRTSLAHELGHVVGYLSNSSITMNDPRSKPQGNRWTVNPGDAVRASEREAWDIAKVIDPGIDMDNAKQALDTYNDPEMDKQFKMAIVADALMALMHGKDEDVN
jgi:hypothetical protein